jgi:Rrf2 family protein
LKNAGIIRSWRGAHGGYTLAQKPEEITVNEIVSAVEGPISLVDCVDSPNACEKSDFCITREIWKGAGDAIINYFKALTLKDLLNMEKDGKSIFEEDKKEGE